MLESLLSTRPSAHPIGSMFQLADVLEQAQFFLSGWQADGPGVRVLFHGPGGTISATLPELQATAARLEAGHPDAWHALVLQDGTTPAGGGPPLPETLS
jgi:hypothetical protein